MSTQDDDGAEVKGQFFMAMVSAGRSRLPETAGMYQEIVGQVDRHISDWIKGKLRNWETGNTVEPHPTSVQ